jgi:single-strand DNA-binding protein
MSAKITVVGNVGRLETRSMPDGTKVTNFSVASNKKIKGEERVTWVNCVAFRGLAEMLEQHLAKGQKVYCLGDFSQRDWEKDGIKHYRVECVVQEFEFCGTKSENNNGQNNSAPPPDDFDDDIPF